MKIKIFGMFIFGHSSYFWLKVFKKACFKFSQKLVDLPKRRQAGLSEMYNPHTHQFKTNFAPPSFLPLDGGGVGGGEIGFFFCIHPPLTPPIKGGELKKMLKLMRMHSEMYNPLPPLIRGTIFRNMLWNVRYYIFAVNSLRYARVSRILSRAFADAPDSMHRGPL
jgi:hypothetical protein